MIINIVTQDIRFCFDNKPGGSNSLSGYFDRNPVDIGEIFIIRVGNMKVAICHYLGDGNGNPEYIMIFVSECALDAHIAHGDDTLDPIWGCEAPLIG